MDNERKLDNFNPFNSRIIKNYIYYILIFFLSVVALVFLPMLGTDAEGGLNLPTTTAGWITWIITKLLVAIINVLIFHSFNLQGKLNVKDNERFLKAVEIMGNIHNYVYIPMSPERWNRQTYGVKGVTIFLTTLLSAFALTECILKYDYISLITYAITVVLGLVFGFFQMKKSECYWSDEYYYYALYMLKQKEKENELQRERQGLSQPSRTGIEEHSRPR